MKVDLSCPIELWEYALPTAENAMIRFTFFNLGERTIASIQITVTCFDEKDAVLSRRVERPMALDARGRAPFEVTLSGEGLPVEAVDLAIDKVWYEDGSEWRRQQDVRLVDYTPNDLPPNRKLEQLRYVAGNDAVGFPSLQENVWVCVCGRVNALEDTRCLRCDRKRDEVFELYSQEAVQAVIDARETELEDKARMAREEASRQEFMRQDRERRKKRARRTRTIVISAVLAVAVLSYFFVVLGLPELRYQTALAAMTEGDYAAAREGFAALEEYRDAPDMVKESDFRQAQAYIASRNISQIDAAIPLLEALGTYPGAAELIQEAMYQKGLLYLEDEDYETASGILAGLSGYQNADELHKQAEYQLAMRSMEDKDYDEAARRFRTLGNYLDAAAMANECVYRPAMELIAEAQYSEAADLLAKIPGYRDANNQRLDALYKDAMQAQAAGEHEYAAERFEMLGDYEDAPEQVTHSIYLAANTARDNGKYDIATKLYATIPDYQDAQQQLMECIYLPAQEKLTAGEYEEAAELFRQIPGYKDADDLLKESVYLPANAAMDAENYEEAVALYRQIPGYGDADKFLQQAEYLHAEQLLEKGELSEAASAFAALGDYSDAADREMEARYDLAEAAFTAGEYEEASRLFEALGRYSNAQTRVKECAYELAMALLDQKDYEAAYEAFAQITDYQPATSMMSQAAYRLGEKLEGEGDLQGAADAFAQAGKYEDAVERMQDAVYQLATDLMQAGDYQRAGELFDSISDYTDAGDKRDESYDLWLSEKSEQAVALYAAEDYQGVVDLLKDLDVTTLPKSYADTEVMYLDSNLKIARNLIAEDRALEAYGYLMSAKGYRNADELLEKNIYQILGTWETSDGTRYAFYLNGTADLAGRQAFFNMVNDNPYGIFIGPVNDITQMERTYNYSSGSEKTLRLREEETDKIIALTRVKGPEVSATSDSEASIVLGGQTTSPLNDIIELEGSPEASPEPTQAPDPDAGDDAIPDGDGGDSPEDADGRG